MIEFRHYYKKLRGKIILEDIHMDFERGKVYCLVGENASGKTMFLRAISGLILPDQGEIRVDGKIIGKDISFPESLGILIESPGFWEYYTGFENLHLLAQIKKQISFDEIKAAIARVGLDPEDTRIYKKFSLGMKQRLGIAQAIMERPDLILLDEPTNALDENGIGLICDIIKEEKKRGATIFFATHDKLRMDGIADETLKIAGGKVTLREADKVE